MWNDTDIPRAYLITFRSYGTWLHGDKRGSVDRFHNQYKSPYLPPDGERHKHTLSQLSSEVVTLTAKQRELVEQAIRETCEFRKWVLLAINVRTNHVHLVVSIGISKTGSGAKRLQSVCDKENAPERLLALGKKPVGGQR